MVTIPANIEEVRTRISSACERSHRSPHDIRIRAVTKNVMAMDIRTALDCGLRDFGENRIQEAETKIVEMVDLRSYINWHMIGHLQSNKTKLAAGLFDIIHSIDSVKLARLLSKQASKTLPVLVQVNVSGEETKFGFEIDQAGGAIEAIRALPNIDVVGLMTIAPMVDDPEDVRPFFKELRQLRDDLGLQHLSMGMSDDYEVAVEEGATMVRIGRAIFSKRRRL
jgi:pyridoxal phosphate enzyme (YggS family)